MILLITWIALPCSIFNTNRIANRNNFLISSFLVVSNVWNMKYEIPSTMWPYLHIFKGNQNNCTSLSFVDAFGFMTKNSYKSNLCLSLKFVFNNPYILEFHCLIHYVRYKALSQKVFTTIYVILISYRPNLWIADLSLIIFSAWVKEMFSFVFL